MKPFITAVTLVVALISSSFASGQLPNEQLYTEALPPAHPDRLYYTDLALTHIADGRVILIDGRSLTVEGMVSTGGFAQTTISDDRSKIISIGSYYSRLYRGDFEQVILVYDATTLALKEEIPYTLGRFAMAIPYVGTLRTLGNDRFLLVQNATPASSVTIVDLVNKKMVTEVPTPGCWVVYPSKTTLRFGTLCGDGTMLTVSLDRNGQVLSTKKTRKFFDADKDALFISAAQDGDIYHFASFLGNVVSVNVSGEVAQVIKTFPMGRASDKGNWRPSGYQPLAIHKKSGTLYVTMHKGGTEGSHKDLASELWVIDAATGKRVSRVKTPNATGVASSQADNPRIYTIDASLMAVHAFEGGPRKLKLVNSATGFGDSPTQMEVQ